MGRSLISLYALAVCFCTLMCLMIVLGVGAYSLVRIVAPEFTIGNQTWAQTNEQHVQWFPDQLGRSAAELTKAREDGRLAAVQYERRGAMQMLVYVMIIGTIDGVVYALHWRLATKLEQARESC